MTFQDCIKIDIETFLKLAAATPVVDVRSPSEYLEGHIPGALNIPLFDDKERESVGIAYNKEGRSSAILKGLELTGPSMHSRLESALKLSKDGRLLIHCWRGGMRSEAMAWLFSQAGIECKVLQGGYKAYRHHVLSALSAKRKMITLGGLTGTGKTRILRILAGKRCRVIDLEGLANHKGSAFGSLGQLPQPSSEHFANLLHNEWNTIDNSSPIWLEDESMNIGSIFMPEEFYRNMQKSPAIILLMDVNTRLVRLVEEYSQYPRTELEAAVMKISRRMGGDKAKEAVQAIASGDIAQAVEIVLNYYDKAYMYGLKNRRSLKTIIIRTETEDPEKNAERVLEASVSLNWDI